MDSISERNPDLDEMKERGWAWLQRSKVSKTCGAPYTDDEYAMNAVQVHREEGKTDEGIPTQELIIVWW